MSVLKYELTAPQKSILLTEQFNENTCVSNICGTLSIKQTIDVDALERAINLFIEKNDSMRIHLFGEGSKINQFIKDYSFVAINKVKINVLYSLSNLEKDVINQHFTILNNDLYRFIIFINEDGTGGFIANLHHIISDAWTMSLLIDQIMSYYYSLITNKKIDYTKNDSYIDYIFEEQKYKESSKFERAKNFWENQFNDLEFSYLKDFQSSSYEGCRKCFSLTKKKTNLLLDFCNNNKTSIFSLFMAVLNIYLAKINNTNSSIVGTPILNRSNFKEKNTTGMYISTVPFRINIDRNCNCIDFIHKISKHELSVFRNQRYPYNLLLDNIRKKFNITKNLFDVSLSYQNARNHRNTSSIPYSCKWLFNNCVVNNLDIHLYDIDDTGMINIYYDFKKDLFSEDDIELLHLRIMEMIENIISNPNLKISDLEILSFKEKNYILNEYNNKISNTNNFVSVYDLFKNFYMKTPNKLAVSYKNTNLTYKQLNTLANLIALKLKKYNVKKGDIICLAFSNSIEFIASVIATQKLGICYIPIDINYPNDRIEYIAKNSNSKLILTDKNALHSISLDKNTLTRICLSDFNYKDNCENIECNLTEQDLAYIIYTSGSTGKPKGVKICHGSLANYISWAIKKYTNSDESNFPFFSSVAFDLTVTSIYTPLCSGNSIYIYKNDNVELLLKNIISDNKVQVMKLTPAHFTLLQDLDLSNCVINRFILGGDILTKEICEKITSLFSHDIHIYNEYGPTEATVGCMIYEYSKLDPYTSVPIGYPIDNTQILLLNNSLELVPLGTIGEMYISGKCLACGYTDEQKTKQNFIKNPFNTNEFLYKTGDLAILHQTGIIEYICRSDFQVKLNGYRIELGEIQSVLLTNPLIKDTFVSVIEIDNHKILCAYYVSDDEIENLPSFLKKYLPNYMIPTHFIKLNALPLTINGKVDKSLLPLPSRAKSKYVKPQNELEEIFQNLFTQLLKPKNKLSVTDNFFDYYVDSLLLIKAQSMLYSKGISVNTQYFYEYPTIRKLSDFLLNHENNNSTIIMDNGPDIKEILAPINKHYDFNNIILFGATGFLGIHILYYLLINTSSKIFCVIRKKDNINPLKRLINKFSFYFNNIDINIYLNRIEVIEGNILEENFGLTPEKYNFLGKTCDCIIDTAALVKHYGNYELFKKTNVNSTKKMITFCSTFNIPLHYVSTMSVSGFGLVNTPSADFTETDLYIGQAFNDNVYVRSKFEAEKAIIEACKSKNFKATIYRIGTVTNRYSDGAFQENFNDNAFLNRLSAFIKLKQYPKEISNYPLEFTPVDYCAEFIVKLLSYKHNNLDIYHLYNNNYISTSILLDTLKNFGVNITPVSLNDFKNTLANSKTNYFGITAYLKNITSSNTLNFSNTKTLSALNSLNLHWPLITPEYIHKILVYLTNLK